MMKQILLELLLAYRMGKLSREAFEKRLDELYFSAIEQIKNALDIDAIFVSLSFQITSDSEREVQ